MSSANDPTLWRVNGMSGLSGLERDVRELLARDYLDRLRSEVSAMPVAPRRESLAWAVDELNESAGCVDAPETPQARSELDWVLSEVVEKLRASARPGG